MWDYEMSADEVNVTTCGPAGNVVSWDTLKKKGDAMESVKAFPGCNGKSGVYVSINLQAAIEDRQVNHQLSTQNVLRMQRQ